MFSFQNNQNYIILSNNTLPPNNPKYFEINNYNLDTSITTKDFSLKDITNFTIDTKASLINSVDIGKNKNLAENVTLGYMNTIKIELKQFIEYNLKDNNIKIIVNKDYISGSIITPAPLHIQDEVNSHINYISIHFNPNNYLTLSIIYTIYLKKP